jgi:hypothetical protein
LEVIPEDEPVYLGKGWSLIPFLRNSNQSIVTALQSIAGNLTIAKNRSTAPAATWQDEVQTQYLTNNSWRYEMKHFFTAIKNNKPIQIGNSMDALELMKIMDKIYAQKEF